MKVVARRSESPQWQGGRSFERLSALVNARCLSKQAHRRQCGLAASRSRFSRIGQARVLEPKITQIARERTPSGFRPAYEVATLFGFVSVRSIGPGSQ
jgi:hypothetical protein